MRHPAIARRLILVVAVPAVLALTLAGLRLADTVRSGEAYGRIGHIVGLNQRVNGLVQAMEDERAATGVFIADGRKAAGLATLKKQYVVTDRRAAALQRLIAHVSGDSDLRRPSATKILGTIAKLPALRRTATLVRAPALAAISGYSGAIGSLLGANGVVASLNGNFALITSAHAADSLSRMENSLSLQQAILGATIAAGHFAPHALTALTTAEAWQASDIASFRTSATPEQYRALTTTLAEPLVRQAQAVVRRAIAAGSGALPVDGRARAQWAAGMTFTVGWMRSAGRQLASWMVAYADGMRRSALRSALTIAGLVLAAMLLIVVITVITARSVARPLRRLEAAALAEDAARRRDNLDPILVAQLRRCRFLVEPLLQLIDHFEFDEADPERLEALFQMDHLATRMRRVSDSALALAGDQASRPWTEPVTLADLMRAAVSETDQCDRVVLDVEPAIPLVPSAAVAAATAVDIVHLLAELLENATTFSPAMTQVIASGRTARDGGWLISIADRGIGMPEDQLRRLNEQMASPPLADAVTDGHIGLFAVAQLAARHGIGVTFAQPPDGGTFVQMHVPATLISRVATPAGPQLDPHLEHPAGPHAAAHSGVALLGAPLRSQASHEHGALVHRAATAAVSAQIAQTRLTTFQHGSRRARTEVRIARENNRTRDG